MYRAGSLATASTIAVALTLLVAPLSPAAPAPYQFKSDEGGYSVAFPAMPKEEITQENNARTVLNALNHDNGYYAVVHVDNAFATDANDELEGNIARFTK